MKKISLVTIATVLKDVEFENKDAIMEELDTEINRGADVKAAKEAEYEAAWDAIHEVLVNTAQPLTVAEIFGEAEDNLPEGFGKGRVQYGLLHNWAEEVVKIDGKPNTYRLK